MCSSDCFLAILALLFPPLPVWVKRGICSADSVINILLCVLGFIPGLLHAWYIIAKYPEPEFDYEAIAQDAEGGGRVTYVVVHPNHRSHHSGHITTTSAATAAAPKPQDNMNYGTAAAAAPAAAPASAPAEASSSAAGPSDNGNGGEGRSDGPPPSYAQVVAGDNKIQSQD